MDLGRGGYPRSSPLYESLYCLATCTYMYVQVKAAKFGNDPFLRDYKLSINHQMLSVEGRILQPPAIQYKGERTVSVVVCCCCLLLFVVVCCCFLPGNNYRLERCQE